MSTDLDGFLAVAEDVLGQMKEALPRLDRHVTFLPPGPVETRAAIILDRLRQAATDLNAALQEWDDLEREQDQCDAVWDDTGEWDEPTWSCIIGGDLS